MRVLHLRGGVLGARVGEVLAAGDDDVVSVDDLGGLRDELTARGPADWFVSAGFRHIVPAGLLAQAADSVNVHPSYLPWGRGAHPNVWAIVDGEPAGVSLHRMVPEVDAGAIWARRRVPTTFGDLACDVYERLLGAAVALFAESWPSIRTGSTSAVEQEAGGSVHRVADLARLADLDLDAQVSWRQALDVLRGLTFPPHRNLVVVADGIEYHVEVRVTKLGEGREP